MVSSLSISLAAPALRAAPAHAAIAKVQSLPMLASPADAPTLPLAVAAPSGAEVVVPGSGDVKVVVEPGLYNVQVILPTGRILQENCEVGDGETLDLTFIDDLAADDSFSLQGLVGSDDAATVLDQLVKSRSPATPEVLAEKPAARELLSADDLIPVAVEAEPPTPVTLHVGGGTLRGPDCWTLLDEPSLPFPGTGEWTELPSEARHQCTALWHVPDLPLDGKRHWGLVQAHGCTELLSLPLPWRRTQTFSQAMVEVAVDPCAKGRSMGSVGICDPELEGLLSVLDRGRLGAARPLIEALDTPGNIGEIILRKVENPLAACAAAYVGLAIFDPGEQERWDSWLPNIMKLFPTIPDGGIVHARRIILRPSGPDENKEALAALKQAFAAGVPYYSVGVLLMREMLSLFSEDEEAVEMLEKVSSIASRVDLGQTFTVLRYPHR